MPQCPQVTNRYVRRHESKGTPLWVFNFHPPRGSHTNNLPNCCGTLKRPELVAGFVTALRIWKITPNLRKKAGMRMPRPPHHVKNNQLDPIKSFTGCPHRLER